MPSSSKAWGQYRRGDRKYVKARKQGKVLKMSSSSHDTTIEIKLIATAVT